MYHGNEEGGRAGPRYHVTAASNFFGERDGDRETEREGMDSDFEHSEPPVVLPLMPHHDLCEEVWDPTTSTATHPGALLDGDVLPGTGRIVKRKRNSIARMLEGGSDEDPKYLLLQIPETLPIDARHFDGASSSSARGCRLADIPSNTKIGKLLIYDDGSAQMKIGDVHFDIEEASAITVSHELLAMNIPEGRCTSLGGVYQKAKIVPDVSSILDPPASE